MEPIFNFRAQTVGWLDDAIAFSGDGRPAAFINDGAVFAASDGQYLGQSEEGVFHDRLGCTVAFVQGSAPCAALTMPQDGPLPPTLQSRVVPIHAAVPAILPHRAEPLGDKSSLDWGHFVMGCEAHPPWKDTPLTG